jgi:hypothetical protein
MSTQQVQGTASGLVAAHNPEAESSSVSLGLSELTRTDSTNGASAASDATPGANRGPQQPACGASTPVMHIFQ